MARHPPKTVRGKRTLIAHEESRASHIWEAVLMKVFDRERADFCLAEAHLQPYRQNRPVAEASISSDKRESQ